MLACPVRWLLKASAQGPRCCARRQVRELPLAAPRGAEPAARRGCVCAQVPPGASPPGRVLRARHRGAVAGGHEFGPGWDLVVALAFRALGVEQTLVDIAVARPSSSTTPRQARAPGARPRSGERTFASSARTAAPIPGRARRAFRDHVSRPAGSERHRVAECVIRLRLGTSTLEHVPADDIGPLLEECRRLPDGRRSDELHRRPPRPFLVHGREPLAVQLPALRHAALAPPQLAAQLPEPPSVPGLPRAVPVGRSSRWWRSGRSSRRA